MHFIDVFYYEWYGWQREKERERETEREWGDLEKGQKVEKKAEAAACSETA